MSVSPDSAVLLLPSLRSSPLDSPELLRFTPRPAAQSEPALLPWAVPVLTRGCGRGGGLLDDPAPTCAMAPR